MKSRDTLCSSHCLKAGASVSSLLILILVVLKPAMCWNLPLLKPAICCQHCFYRLCLVCFVSIILHRSLCRLRKVQLNIPYAMPCAVNSICVHYALMQWAEKIVHIAKCNLQCAELLDPQSRWARQAEQAGQGRDSIRADNWCTTLHKTLLCFIHYFA